MDPPTPARRHTNVTPKATPKSACPKPGYETHTSKKGNRYGNSAEVLGITSYDGNIQAMFVKVLS